MSNLEELILEECESLLDIHTSIGVLSRLKVLNLQGCKNLKTLPNNIGHLTSLTHFNLGYCRNLEQLPEQLGDMKSLEILDVSNTRIRCLPESVMNLAQLKQLYLWNCKSLTATPDFTGIPNLEVLNLGGCESLSDIHSSIGVLSRLKELKLWGCENLKTLPNSIGHLTSLAVLNVSGCRNLEQLPEQLGNLKSLVKLDVSETRIKCFPESLMNSDQLKELDLSDCKFLTATPDFTGMPNLVLLILGRCESLSDIHSSIGVLSQLTNLNLSSCTNLKTLPISIGHLTSLKYLYVGGCGNLEQLPEQLGNLKSLVRLDVSNTRITCLPESVTNLAHLRDVKLRDCNLSNEGILDNLGGLPSLTELNLSVNNFSCLKFSNLWSHLRRLVLNKCTRLIEIQGLENLKSIDLIDLHGCTSLSSTFLNLLFQRHSGLPSGCQILVSKEQIPYLIEYRWVKGSSSISFEVPLDVPRHLSRHNILINYKIMDCFNELCVVKNITSGTEWMCHIDIRDIDLCDLYGTHSILIYGPQDYQMKSGDIIQVSFQTHEGEEFEVGKWGVYLAGINEGVHGDNSHLSGHPLDESLNLKRGRDVDSV